VNLRWLPACRLALLPVLALALACTSLNGRPADGAAGGGGGGGTGGSGGTAASDGGADLGPAPVVARALTGAFRGTCAVMTDDSVRCWGTPAGPDLSTLTSSRPAAVPGLGTVTELVAGYQHYCAVVSGGGVYCWGSDISDGSAAATTEPTPKHLTRVSSVQHMATGILDFCALLPTGTIDCWPDTNQAVNLTNVAAIRFGGFTGCALDMQSSMSCWGQLNGDPTSTTGAAFKVLTNVRDMVISEGSVCALQGATDVTCWSDPTQPPAALSGVGQVLKLVAGPSAICAILTDHTARCWGNIALGESIAPDAGVANFSSATPIALDGAVDIQDMAIGYTHVCVLHSDGSVECKGGNRDGELGDGTMVTRGTFAHVAW
jgi:alpha-tubulin suppressor-like RCC1 family protein